MLLILYFNDDLFNHAFKNISTLDHDLDNPIWNAMISSNSNLSFGTGQIKFFPENLSPFVGLEKVDEASLQQLFKMVSNERIVAIVTARKLNIPVDVNIIRQARLLQMTRENASLPSVNLEGIVPLDKHHVPQMLALHSLLIPALF